MECQALISFSLELSHSCAQSLCSACSTMGVSALNYERGITGNISHAENFIFKGFHCYIPLLPGLTCSLFLVLELELDQMVDFCRQE